MAVAYTRSDLSGYYERVRWQTEKNCEPLEIEDYGVQVVPEASPAKWHLAHTSWFFETFILKPNLPDYEPFHPSYEYLFNSYYNSIGQQFPRVQRGMLSRPTVAEIYRYRTHIDQQMLAFIADFALQSEQIELIVLGLNHEQQHQELMLTDIKRNFWANPLLPELYEMDDALLHSHRTEPLAFDHQIAEGVYYVGNQQDGFAFDNERPAHKQYLVGAKLANRLITNGEFLQFIEDNAYQNPLLWLSDGWAWIDQEKVGAPLYWLKRDGQWFEYTLSGLQPLNLTLPVTHISYYEADAFSRWYGARLATEAEWEIVAQKQPDQGQYFQDLSCHPLPASSGQWFGSVWQWTQSSYSPYPGYQPQPGAVGEYNSKFMGNQMVLKGGSCATSKDHFRLSYRNFFYPHERWQFTGIRLVKDVDE